MIALLVVAAFFSAAPPTVIVDGLALPRSAVVAMKDRTYIALRAAGDALNADVRYDGHAKTVSFTTVVRQVVMRLGDSVAYVNGQPIELDAKPELVAGRVLVPLRALAAGLGASIRFDGAAHRVVVTSVNGGAPPSGAPTPLPVAQTNTLAGTVTSVDLSESGATVAMNAGGQGYRLAVRPGMAIQFRETRGTITGSGSIGQVRPGDTLIAALDASGGLVSLADIFTGYEGTVASVAGWSMVLTNGRVVNGSPDATSVSLNGKAAVMSDLAPADMVTVRADPKTGKVRDVVALSPASAIANATAIQQSGSLRIDTVAENASRPFRAGQTLIVSAAGPPGAVFSFDIGDLIGGMPMREVRPGKYEGTFAISVGTNFINAPIVVRAKKGDATAQSVAPDPLTIITTPPSVKDVAPAAGTTVGDLRPSVFVTFATLGDNGMQPGSLRLWVDGVDVTARATRTSEYISYRPERDIGSGSVAAEVRGSDAAGNPLVYKWSFIIAGS
jgi:hypothetical protein